MFYMKVHPSHTFFYISRVLLKDPRFINHNVRSFVPIFDRNLVERSNEKIQTLVSRTPLAAPIASRSNQINSKRAQYKRIEAYSQLVGDNTQ